MALDLGGLQHAALLTNIFDGAGFLIAAVFSKAAMTLGGRGNWAPIFTFMAFSGSVSTLSMAMAMWINYLKRKKNKVSVG